MNPLLSFLRQNLPIKSLFVLSRRKDITFYSKKQEKNDKKNFKSSFFYLLIVQFPEYQ